MDQIREVQPHLLARLYRLLDFVVFLAIVKVKCEQSIGGAVASVGDGDDRIVRGVQPPSFRFPPSPGFKSSRS
jgi:hypothetical protein